VSPPLPPREAVDQRDEIGVEGLGRSVLSAERALRPVRVDEEEGAPGERQVVPAELVGAGSASSVDPTTYTAEASSAMPHAESSRVLPN